MRKSQVTIECFEQNFDCYLSHGDWNGWALPNFEQDAAFALMEACNAIADMGGVKMLYDVETDTFYTDDGAESWKGFDAEGKHLYDIGSHSWCWWEVKSYTREEVTAIYQKFCLQWMIDHGHTLEELIHELAEYIDDCDEPLIEASYLWEQDRGFGGEIWPCFNEWLENEGVEYKQYIEEDEQ